MIIMLGKTLSNVFEKLQSTGKLIVYETQKNVRLRKQSWRFSIACHPRVKDVTSKAIGFCLTQKHFFAPHLHLILNCLFLFWLAFQLSLMRSTRYLLGDILVTSYAISHFHDGSSILHPRKLFGMKVPVKLLFLNLKMSIE